MEDDFFIVVIFVAKYTNPIGPDASLNLLKMLGLLLLFATRLNQLLMLCWAASVS